MNRDGVVEAALLVKEALVKAGPNPHYHHRIMARQRIEWPRLFAAIDRLMEELDADEPAPEEQG